MTALSHPSHLAAGGRSSWLVTPRPLADARLRLFCFPFAGGSAAFYHGWSQALPEVMEVTSIELPGRGMRFGSPLRRHIAQILDPVVAALGPLCDRPVVIFGHSLGALIGFEVARRLQAEGLGVAALMASGRRGPCTHRDGPPLHQLSDMALVQQLDQYNGTPAEILADPEIRDLFLPIIRADLQVNETYVHTASPKLGCPIYAFAGATDEEASPELVALWHKQTARDFLLRVMPGGHFFLKEQEEQFLGYLSDQLTTIARP